MRRTAELDIIFFGSAMQGTVLVTAHQDRKGVFQLKGKLELSAKWQGSSKAEKRKAAKNRIKNAYDNEAEVEIIPAVSELEADKPKSYGLQPTAESALMKMPRLVVMNCKSNTIPNSSPETRTGS